MKIAVCMKQVPGISDGAMDEKTGLLIRNGLENIVNVYDLSALEIALQMKETVGAEVHVFTMGPKQAENVLKEAYARGADKGYLISDKAFAGADVFATSYTLMQAICSVGEYELVLCGKQTTDGDTSLVSGALAKWLDVPGYIGVSKIEQTLEQKIIFWQNAGCIQKIKTTYPCLMAVERDICIPRLPSLKLKMQSKKKEIRLIGLNDLKDKESSHYGLHGSATKVKKIFPPQKQQKHNVHYWNQQTSAKYLADVITELIN